MAYKTKENSKDQGGDAGLSVLFLAALPLILWVFQGSALGLIFAVLQFGLFALALRLIARGLETTRAYEAARVARRPKVPQKLVGSALIGLVLLILAGHQFQTIFMPLGCGLVGFALSVAAFGIDPMKDKGFDDPEELARRRLELWLTETETLLEEARARVSGLGDTDLTQRTTAHLDGVMQIVRIVGSDPLQSERMPSALTKFAEILTREVLRLEGDWDGPSNVFARRRYLAKLKVLVTMVEDISLKSGLRAGKDAFDMEADLLLERMRAGAAA